MPRRFHSRALALLTGVLTVGSLSVTVTGGAGATTSNWTLTAPSAKPAARSGAAMAYDAATGQTILFGGTTTGPYSVGAALADTWAWDGTTWHQLHPATGPPATQGAAMAYDPDTRELVMFGGADGSVLSNATAQTWTWNGVTWGQAHPATSPPAVSGAAMAFDAQTDQMVLTGGSSLSGSAIISNTQTWLWDGANWADQIHVPDLPSDDMTMAYDSATSELVLVQEGIGSDSVAWVWNGSNWYQRTTADPTSGPPSREGAVLVYSPAAQELLLEGGQTVVDNFIGDVWAWTGTGWTQRTDGSPYPMADSAAAIDSAGQLVLFGGLEGDITTVHPVADTWVYAPTRLAPTAATPQRIAGTDREATAIATSAAAYPAAGSASAVVLVRQDDFPDALTGGPLAAARKGPLLLTSAGALDDPVATELKRVLAPGGTVYLLGGTSALSAGVASAVTALGFTVDRLAGSDRYGTAVAVADALADPTTVFEASGTDFADALSAVPAAIASGGAILLTNGASQVAETSAYLVKYAKIRYAVGGPAAAADPVATAIVGGDRYATSAQVAAAFFPAATSAAVASGMSFPDALAAGPVAGASSQPVLLVPASGALAESTSAYLTLHDGQLAQVRAFGGTSAVGDGVLAAVTAALSTP